MRSVSSARLAVALAALLVIAFAIKSPLSFLTIERTVIASSPSPGARAADTLEIPLRPRSRLCVGPLTLDPATGAANFFLPAAQPGTATLEVVARAPGYRDGTTVRVDIAPPGTPVSAPLRPPPRVVSGNLCVRNRGGRTVRLIGTNNPNWIGIPKTSIDGQELMNQAMALTFIERKRQSILDRLGTIVRHATDLTGGAVPFAVGWLIIVGFVVATPVAILLLFWLALRESGLDD
jgi:hypothetical protein